MSLNSEVQYGKPVFTDLKTGDFLLVKCMGGNKKNQILIHMLCEPYG